MGFLTNMAERVLTGFGLTGGGSTGLGLVGDVANQLLPGRIGRRAGFVDPTLQKRRRRRKALSTDDIKTALTIASAISKKAAENFILQRVRAS